MSNDMIRELFRGVETTLYERLRIIEDILVKQRKEGGNSSMEGVEKRLHETAEQVKRVETFTMKAIEDMNRKFDVSMNSIEQKIQSLREELANKRKVDDRPVELVQALASSEPRVLALESSEPVASATQVEQKAKVALANAVRKLDVTPTPVVIEEEEIVEEEVEEEEVEEEEVEEEVEEEEVEEEEVEEEEVEEEEVEEALTEFEFKGKTYYHDSEYKVYIPDADGAISDPVGIYDPQTKRIRRLP